MDKKRASLNGSELKQEPELKEMVSIIHTQLHEVETITRRMEKAGYRLGNGPLNRPIADSDGRDEPEPQSIQAHLDLIQRRLSEVIGNLNLIAEHFDGLI